MSKIIILKINNSKKAAIKTGTWSNPGANFYDKLMNAFYCEGNVPTGKELEKKIKEGKYLQWFDFLKEAYLVAPVDNIKNSPYGRTPYSRSGCKYPHHVLKGDKLVVSIPGLRSAYICARNQGVFTNHTKENKMIIAHFNKHFKELGITPQWHHGELYFMEDCECKIEQNFRDIYQFIIEQTGINLFDDYDEFNEASHGKLKYDFRMGWDYNTGHQIKVVYSLNNINITDVGDFYLNYNKANRDSNNNIKMNKDEYKDYIQKNIKKKGNNDHQSTGQKVLVIEDIVTKKRLNEVKLMSPISLDGTKYSFTHYTTIPANIIEKARKISSNNNGISIIRVGDIDNNPSFKATSWFSNVIDKNTGENLRFSKLAQAEFIKAGRGIKPDSIRAKKFEIYDTPDLSIMTYENPNKKEALQELYGLERNTFYLIKVFKNAIKNNSYPDGWDYDSTNRILRQHEIKLRRIENDINTIESGKYNASMMKKYHEAAIIEGLLDEYYSYKNKYPDNVDFVPPAPEFTFYEIDALRSSDIELDINESANVLEGSNNTVLSSNIFKECGRSPEDIYKWMHKNISYDKTIKGWKLRTPAETYKDRKGNCHDQSLFESALLHSLGYINGQIFFIEFNKNNPIGGNTHTLTWYRTSKKVETNEDVAEELEYQYYWIENAWEDQAGIHGPYSSINEIKKDILDIYNSDNDINSHKFDGIVFSTLSNYRCGMSLGEYVESWRLEDDYEFSKKDIHYDINKHIKEEFNYIENFVNNPESIEETYSIEEFTEKSHRDLKYEYSIDIKSEDNKKQILMNNETIMLGGKILSSGDLKQYRISDEELEEVRNRDILDEYIESFNIDKDKKKKDFVPIYGIIKQYSLSKFRNDGTIKDHGELSSVRFHKIIKALTKGDNYSHALVSFDDSLTNMYSYEDEGFVIDNIMTKDSWMGTSSIYICVMFVSKEDKKRMEKYVKKLKDHANESRYASANLLKAYIGKPYKIDKRFVCSSFTGYIMSCANPKNLHRDYSRLRPEDITILPRAFYVMNVKDREDFINHKNDIKKKVDAIYDEYKDEIDDYNNHLPKLMLQDRVDKLKTIDKIFDWIIDRL